YLTRAEPAAARSAQALAREAGERGAVLGHHYWRQLALTDMQQGLRREALQHLWAAHHVISDHGGSPAQRVLVGDQFIDLLTLNWDKEYGALEALSTVRAEYPHGSLERSFSLKWCVACGMSTDSPKIQRQAAELLERHLDETT